ncbi:tripartite tricarboxylate transporter substrate binding protein [Siccirubricoccus sp. KC 17139]|uniref:Tripartite tricarboxylate transporter substrate binding protein n=1 Tax=Siccirubricoccus soli TaxID=2899147 RepID=A0ABT1CY51_9PROT|nr:tripartite tricarboxylate transporter substrate binding protein [Siccirubricoccus soli]MCO6414588.1 tripartite tricarboxylate transporter substrate binding protein [Siccirubricoccus soli]MCP2680718.1 tripartite tricarboxylate transporter substrate binding protein [Siccirubricoccus soli]
MRRRSLGHALAAAAWLPALARAQGWPNRPVRLIVPYAPGGANDILARLYGRRLTERLGQPFLVENRPGAQAILGTELAARAAPDGRTLLVAASGPLVFNPAVHERLPYDTRKDLAPVSILAAYPLVVVVPGDSPFRTFQDLMAFAREHPDGTNYGASAASFQLPTELLNQRAGTRFAYTAFDGSAETVRAVAEGEVTMALVDAGSALAAHAAGRVRGLAVTAPHRLPAWRGCPTMAELDYPDLTLRLWSGVLAPAGTPAPILNRLATELAAITREPSVLETLRALSLDPIGSSTEEFRRVIETELPLWAEVARQAGIRPERSTASPVRSPG